MEITTRSYRLVGISPILGTQPSDEKIRTNYLMEKAKNKDMELGMVDPSQDDIDRGVTKFFQDPETGALCLLDYQVKGHLKEALANLSSQNGIKQAASKADNFVFVKGLDGRRVVPFTRDGKTVDEPDRLNERTLRAMTMMGPRVSMVASEEIKDPWEIRFEITLLKNSGTKASEPVAFEAIEDALEYGQLKGIGQWRNGGWGRYIWERID